MIKKFSKLKIKIKKFSENLYFKLPIFLQNIVCSCIGLIKNEERYGGDFKILLNNSIKRKDFYDFTQLEKYNQKKLINFIHYCYHNIPFYREQFNKLGIGPDDIKTKKDLNKLPILNKQTILDNYKSFIPKKKFLQRKVFQSTSGTTGVGLSFYTTISGFREQWATWERYRISHGIKRKYWCAFFGGTKIIPFDQQKPPFWRVNYFGKEVRFSVYHTTPENLDLYIEEIIKRKIKWIHGNPSTIKQLSFRIIETNKQFNLKVKFISLGAENVIENDIKIIYKAFGIKPIQHYGQVEGVANISQCIHGNLIVDEDYSIVELENTNKDNQYRIIGTNFNNYAFPLIRYDTGDIVSIKEIRKKCSCLGRHVSSIEGRSKDYIVLSNNVKVQRVDFILKGTMNVRSSQFIQDKAGEAKLLIVKGNNFKKEDESIIKIAAKEILGNSFNLKLKYVKKINLTNSGKYKFIINNIN